MVKKPPNKLKLVEVETEPDAWDRFEKTIGKIAPPRPHKDDVGKLRKPKSSKPKSQ